MPEIIRLRPQQVDRKQQAQKDEEFFQDILVSCIKYIKEMFCFQVKLNLSRYVERLRQIPFSFGGAIKI